MFSSKFTQLMAAVTLGCCSISASAQWSLDPADSSLHFFSVKKDAIGENHSFLKMTGAIEKQGKAHIEIDLNSVETGIPIRNERMQKLLFKTEDFPQAKVEVNVDMAKLAGLKVGEVWALTTEANIDLHGKQKAYSANLQVVKLSTKKILVTTTAPLIVNAADFDLVGGIDRLKEVAALPAIATAVPVSLSLVFKE